MNIETKFNCGDKVYAIIERHTNDEDYYKIVKGKVEKVRIRIQEEGIEVCYLIEKKHDYNVYDNIEEKNIFATKKDLLDYIGKRIED